MHSGSGNETELHFFSYHPLHILAFVKSFAMTISGSLGFLEMRRWRAKKNIRCFAMYDELTDLLNRRSFFSLSERERIQARRKGTPIALMMIDVDHFKPINDHYGHIAGDRVLAAIAEAARKNLRADELLDRSGGEEFMALLVDVQADKIVEIAERIRTAVQALTVEGVSDRVTVSIGVALCDDLDDSAIERGLKNADAGLYEAKRNSRNRVVLVE